MSETISINCPEGGTFEAYVSSPDGGGPAPAILVVSSIFGVTDGLKHTMDRYASRGFHTVAADPFWRTHPGPGLSDMRATLAAVALLPNWNGKYAVLHDRRIALGDAAERRDARGRAAADAARQSAFDGSTAARFVAHIKRELEERDWTTQL